MTVKCEDCEHRIIVEKRKYIYIKCKMFGKYLKEDEVKNRCVWFKKIEE